MACETSFKDGSNAKIVSLLLQGRADPDMELPPHSAMGCKRPIILAAASALSNVMEVLIEYNCKPDAIDHEGRGAWQLLRSAARSADWLLEKGFPQIYVKPPITPLKLERQERRQNGQVGEGEAIRRAQQLGKRGKRPRGVQQ